MLEEFIVYRKQFFDKVRQDKNFKQDIFLLSSLYSILQRYFTDYKPFLNYVG